MPRIADDVVDQYYHSLYMAWPFVGISTIELTAAPEK
jgi:hypothetical protein